MSEVYWTRGASASWVMGTVGEAWPGAHREEAMDTGGGAGDKRAVSALVVEGDGRLRVSSILASAEGRARIVCAAASGGRGKADAGLGRAVCLAKPGMRVWRE